MAQRNSVLPTRAGGQAALGALREAQIVISKPALPLVDNLPAEDLASCARVSKRMREMVYDDSRWVRRLQLMGCWSEAAARRHAEEARRNSLASVRAHSKKQSLQPVQLSKDVPLISLHSPTSPAHPKSPRAPNGRPTAASGDGFSETPVTAPAAGASAQMMAVDPALEILDRIESIRGAARREYGKAYAVLAPYFKDAIKTAVPANARLFRAYRDPEQQARMVSQLVRFSNADLSAGWAEREAKIEALTKAFEDAVTNEFEDGLRQEDIDGKMKKYARVLFYLNGGQRALDAFMGQNLVTASPYKLGDASDWVSTSSSAEFLQDEYLAFLRRLADEVNNQCNIIDRVFPSAVDAAETFVQKVGRNVFDPYLTKLFDQLYQQQKKEQFVKAIPSTYLQNLSFLETIKSAPRLSQSQTLAAMVHVIYGRYIDNYLQEEFALFKRRSETEVTGWQRQLSQQDASLEAMYMASVNRQADKRDFLSSFKKVVMAPVNIFPTISFGAKASATSSAGSGLNPPSRSESRASNRNSSPSPWPMERQGSQKRMSRSPSPGAEPPTTELEAKAAIMQSRLEGIKTLFSLEVALSLVHMAKSSIERAAIFTKKDGPFAKEAKEQCESIFVLLLFHLGERHVREGFNQAVEHLSKYNPRHVEERGESQLVAPLVTFLELVNVGDLIQQMVDVFYEQELVAPHLTDKTDFLNPVVKAKKRFEQMLDERVAAGLNKSIEVLMAEVEYICATTQNVEDYKPGETGLVINQIVDISTTNTARWVVELVSSHTKMLTGSTDKNMLEVFNQEVGLRLFTALCKHLKRQRISVAGAPRLMSDMNHYFNFVQTLKNKDLLQYFKALRELSQIYLIDGKNAKELAIVIADHDRFSGIFGAEEVLEFAERRSDWYHVKPRVEKAMYGIGCGVM